MPDRNLNFWNEIRFFSPSEFDSPDQNGSGKYQMDEWLIRSLDNLRAMCDFPFKINSGYRSPSHNSQTENSVEKSAHLFGLAVDIACQTSSQRFKLVINAATLGFTRIGVGKNFVHLDLDKSKPQQVIWLYP